MIMHDVITESIRLLKKDEPFVIATVVRTKGMTPQKAGAKQLFRVDGTSVGTLGGGCVEGDIWYYAKEMLRDKKPPEFREYTLNADIAEKDGLVCGGTMYFYLEPVFAPECILPFFEAALGAYQGKEAIAVATVVKCAQRDISSGARLLVHQDGSSSGTLGKPEFNRECLKIAEKIIPGGGNATIATEEGVEIYIEAFTSPPTLIILGGGHVGKAVYNLALTLRFRIIIIDDREDFSNADRFPAAYKTVVANFETALDDLDVKYNSFILIATRGHRFDDMATKAAAKTPARYIGLLGSKRKNLLIFRELLKKGVQLERIKEIHAPVGLNIGALTPEELAVSIMAEIIKCIRGGDGLPMKMAEQFLVNSLT